MAKTPTWQRKAGKSKSGGLNAKAEHLIIELLVVILKLQLNLRLVKEESLFVPEC